MPYAEKTQVPVARTRVEIEALLERHKAKQYGTAVDYDRREARVQFRLENRIVRFLISLPPADSRSEKFARLERQRWRALLLVIKAKLESVESAIETFESAFLAQIVLPNDDTVGEAMAPLIAEAYTSGRMPKLLTAGAQTD
jgi:hypothetical protein